MRKPRIRCYRSGDTWWYAYPCGAVVRIEPSDDFDGWGSAKMFNQVPYVGY